MRDGTAAVCRVDETHLGENRTKVGAAELEGTRSLRPSVRIRDQSMRRLTSEPETLVRQGWGRTCRVALTADHHARICALCVVRVVTPYSESDLFLKTHLRGTVTNCSQTHHTTRGCRYPIVSQIPTHRQHSMPTLPCVSSLARTRQAPVAGHLGGGGGIRQLMEDCQPCAGLARRAGDRRPSPIGQSCFFNSAFRTPHGPTSPPSQPNLRETDDTDDTTVEILEQHGFKISTRTLRRERKELGLLKRTP